MSVFNWVILALLLKNAVISYYNLILSSYNRSNTEYEWLKYLIKN